MIQHSTNCINPNQFWGSSEAAKASYFPNVYLTLTTPNEIVLRESGAAYESLAELYRTAGLGNRSLDEIETVFKNSKYVVTAFYEGQLLGSVRAFGDEFDCCVICDLAVLPDFQGKGIGTALMIRILGLVKHHQRIMLYAMPGKESFYRRHGFHKMKTAMMASYILDQEFARRIGFIE